MIFFIAQTTRPAWQFWASGIPDPVAIALWTTAALGVAGAIGGLLYKLGAGLVDGFIEWLFGRRKKIRDAAAQELLEQLDRDRKIAEAQKAVAQIAAAVVPLLDANKTNTETTNPPDVVDAAVRGLAATEPATRIGGAT